MIMEKAIFAGGCFWCMVKPFHKYDGVHQVISGYTGGHTENPTYEEVCSNATGHREAIEVTFDPEVITYEQLVSIFWKQIDPTNPNGQFGDLGDSYKTAIYYVDETQKEIAERSKRELEENGPFEGPIVTDILPASTFYPAEDYHQDYYQKQPFRYERYAYGSGRVPFLERVWGDKE